MVKHANSPHTDELPSWAWSLALSMAALVMVATVIVGYNIAWEGDRAELEEHRALYQALSLAAVYQESGPTQAQAYIDALGESSSEIEEAFVIGGGSDDEFGISRGQAYLVAKNADLKGKTLFERVAAGGRRDKVRADRYAHTTSGVAMERRPGRSAPEYLLEREVLGTTAVWSAQVPVLKEEKTTQGSAGVSIAAKIPSTPTPWLALVVCLLLAMSCGALIGRVSGARRVLAMRVAVGLLGIGLTVTTLVPPLA